MHLINDIKQDKYFKKAIKILGLFCLAFFLVDALAGFILTSGLERYYGLNTDSEIALVGHSHLMLGVNKQLLEDELNVPIAKYTREGVNIADRHIMIQQLLSQNPKLKTVVYGIDAWSFTGEGLSANSFTLFYPFIGIKEVDEYVKNLAGFSNYWLHKLVKTTRFNEGLISGALRGYLKNWDNLKYGELDVENLRKEIEAGHFRKINNSDENIEILKQTIKVLDDRGISVILVYVPTIDLYNEAEPEKFEASLAIINGFKKEFQNVRVLNYLEPFSHNYDLFFDPIHMNPKGQKKVTLKLIADMRSP